MILPFWTHSHFFVQPSSGIFFFINLYGVSQSLAFPKLISNWYPRFTEYFLHSTQLDPAYWFFIQSNPLSIVLSPSNHIHCNWYPSDVRFPTVFLNDIEELGLARNETFLLSEVPNPAKLLVRLTFAVLVSASGLFVLSVWKKRKNR